MEHYEMKFNRKGYGRIFVEKEEDIPKLKQIMSELNEEEMKYYFCDDIITVYRPENYKAVYTHKFDDMDFTEVLNKAWEAGIKCFVVFGKITGYED